MRFSREQKLGRASQFLRLRQEGRRFDTGPFIVWFRTRAEGEASEAGGSRRFAINASRRVGPAVVRNRLKRVLREAFRLNQEKLPVAVDVWIQLKGDCTRMRPVELARRLVEAGGRFSKTGNRAPRTDDNTRKET